MCSYNFRDVRSEAERGQIVATDIAVIDDAQIDVCQMKIREQLAAYHP